jgi:short-subunit dehydrogenase
MNIVITGITSGLGKALIYEFQKNIENNVIGIYRKKVKLDFANKKVFLFKCDFSKKKDINILAKKIKKFGEIDCVINNHASLGGSKSRPKKLFFLNYYSIEYFTLKIFDNIKKSKKKLVINISSHAHKNIAIKKNFYELSNWDVYKLSKLSLILLSKKLTRLGLNSISINPGRMKTNFGTSHYLGFFIWLYLFLFGKNPMNIAKKIYKIFKNENFTNGSYYSNFKIKKYPIINNKLRNYIKDSINIFKIKT